MNGSTTTETTGLTTAEVDDRRSKGLTNTVSHQTSRTFKDILGENIFTLFNLILVIALVLVLATGRWPDALFGLVIVVNAAIGIVTEYRAKRTLDNLAILDAPFARVTRDGAQAQVRLEDIVRDDVVHLATGDQVPADGEVLETRGLEVDESLLTGESRSVHKHVGDEVLSGSSIVAGSAVYRVTRVGEDGYANRITAAAKKYSTVQSDLRDGVNKILRVVSFGIVPIALLLAWSQLRATGGWETAFQDGHWKDAVVAAVAGVVGMIPEGLVLLTSLNFAIASMLLARQKVLVQELAAVEVLARVDVLCLDKTGTITDGTVSLTGLKTLADLPGAMAALAAFAADSDGNATSKALAAGVAEVTAAAVTGVVPFSSARKWSAVATADGAWVMGAPEILLGDRTDSGAEQARALVAAEADTGARVLLLARSPQGLPATDAPLGADLVPAVVAVLGERIRPDAAQTLAYFREQGVHAKVISGDNPDTVAAIATRVGLRGEGVVVEGYDARNLPTDDPDEFARIVDEYDVFGRVTPEQKRELVHVLQGQGHVVAMTGDGVNDALALKDADLGIAMGNGAGASKAVARIVLVDGRFSTLPGVLGQGRRVMANMERVATLFLTKTTYAALLAVVVVLLAWPYPFLPRHMTVIGSLTIGIPAFFLALPPNNQRFLPGFLRRCLSFAIPLGIVTGALALVVFSVVWNVDSLVQARTAVYIVLIVVGLWVVGVVARPWAAWKIAMIVVLGAAAAATLWIPWVHELVNLEHPSRSAVGVIVGAIVVGCLLVEAIHRWLTPWLASKNVS
ncbi:cation-transporting ATPase E [Sanguibacter gelidistatuariae]|uniref:Cation-transporting ATPase E n=1 Tax=Sanguibacter gelidistatuariae TaxID=1814289 RepID=A0A1G6RKF6_9MICO|nr:HAD-IC family P-type ATPase [Sanguibacter gelidistatuariae]SDD04475.1 cation-transporting ATPase E [Sanguibacter gelidistatuariae]